VKKGIQSKSADSANPYYWPMLESLPYFRALLRAVEGIYYEGFDLSSPILDIGCGDGHFASLVFQNLLDVGIDPERKSLSEAKERKAYRHLIQSLGDKMPFPSNYFSSAISNSVLEHIPGVQDVLNESGRLLKQNGLLLFCVPNHRWPENLKISGILEGFKMEKLAKAYRGFFIRISRHINMLSAQEWGKMLEVAGYRLEKHWDYFPPKALHTLELGHYFGLPSLLTRWLFGRWVLVSSKWNLRLTYLLTKKYADSRHQKVGTYTWIAARKN
jgi:SAM-dependent methyltransferase